MSRLKRGKWYRVWWHDFQVSLDGSPEEGVGALRVFIGEFWGWKRREVDGKVWSAAIFALFGEETPDRSQSGWFACPRGAFLAEEIPDERVSRQSRRQGSVSRRSSGRNEGSPGESLVDRYSSPPCLDRSSSGRAESPGRVD